MLAAVSVLDSLLEHFSEPLAAPVKPKPKGGKGKPRNRHGKLAGLTDAALKARLKSASGSTPAERQAAAALLQSRRDASEAHAAKTAPAEGKAEPAVLEALLEGAALSERFVSSSNRQAALDAGHALKGADGSIIFPIETAKDAENAATLWVSGHHKTPAAKAFIVKRAKALGASGALSKLGASS